MLLFIDSTKDHHHHETRAAAMLLLHRVLRFSCLCILINYCIISFAQATDVNGKNNGRQLFFLPPAQQQQQQPPSSTEFLPPFRSTPPLDEAQLQQFSPQQALLQAAPSVPVQSPSSSRHQFLSSSPLPQSVLDSILAPVVTPLNKHLPTNSNPVINDAPPMVQTSSGRLIGRLARSASSAFVATYLGVPFAKAPVGDLRFRKPEPFNAVDTMILNATAFAPLCSAIKILPNAFDFPSNRDSALRNNSSSSSRRNSDEAVQVSEDCLYLNVYVPISIMEAAATTAMRYPVMVWIPGGDWNYVIGAQNQIDAVQLAAQSNVIVVSINYRMGPFGFLTTNDKALPGNYGLFDQAMAIQWVRQNIGSFGGNAEAVTLFGHSAGAMSISWHLFSRVLRTPAATTNSSSTPSQSMFRRAILQSGAYIGDLSLSLTENSAAFAGELATRLSCQATTGPASSFVLAECLRRVPEATLRRAAQDDLMLPPFGSLGPVVDGDFIEDDPFNMLYAAAAARQQQGESAPEQVTINAKDVMIGTVLDEGSLALEILPLLTTTPMNFMHNGLNQSEFDALARLFLNGWLPQHRTQPQIYDLIIHKYKNFRTGPEALQARRQNFMDLVGDVLINMGVDLLAEKLSESGVRVFAYQFQHRPSWSQYPSFIQAGHGDELAFIFGAAHDLSSSPAEITLNDRMMRAWAQFASKGDPNPLEPYISQAAWLPYTPHTRHYLAWNTHLRPERMLQNDLRAADIEFWYNVRARLGNFIQQCQLGSGSGQPDQQQQSAAIVLAVANEPPVSTTTTSTIPSSAAPTAPTALAALTLAPAQTFFSSPSVVIDGQQQESRQISTNTINSMFMPQQQQYNLLQSRQSSPALKSSPLLVAGEPEFKTAFFQLPPPSAPKTTNLPLRNNSSSAELFESTTSSTMTTTTFIEPLSGAGGRRTAASAVLSEPPRSSPHERTFDTSDREIIDFNNNSSIHIPPSNRLAFKTSILSPAIRQTATSGNSLDSTEIPPPLLSMPAATAADVAAAGITSTNEIVCTETGWIIGSQLSTQQAEIALAVLAAFAGVLLIILILLLFVANGQRRKLRRRNFLLAADSKSATTTLYANHHHQANCNGHQLRHHNHNHHTNHLGNGHHYS